jgi:hypothetical protein
VISLVLYSCSPREQRTSIFDAIVDLGGCNGLLTNEGRGVVYPAHCGHILKSGKDLYGRTVEFDRCTLHRDATLGRGTDIGYCSISSPIFSPGILTGSLVPEGDHRLVQRSANSVTLHAIAFDGLKNGEFILHVPPGTFCPGDSGSPVIQVDNESVKLVAFASSRRRGEDCEKAGPIRAIPLPTALEWIRREVHH